MTAEAPHDTRTQFIEAARQLFAERGFYGTSIAAIADELGMTKQALIHHFGSKEKLYGEVLARLSNRFTRVLEDIEAGGGPAEDRLRRFCTTFCEIALTHPDDTRLIMRELLDNRQRAEQADAWYLKPFLENLTNTVLETERWQDATPPEALALVYNVLGAVSYFAISEPTLSRMFGPTEYEATRRAYPDKVALLAEGFFGTA
ncbi:TetR/AcrR family transcriptional regulator [Shimia sp. SDUM112013]|uniref:TetR/AcrR family transcriptional regulator n=1 Tax=Shimia sp. SDUM112013 TaxID=3136160 RepID=UPI0032F02EE6